MDLTNYIPGVKVRDTTPCLSSTKEPCVMLGPTGKAFRGLPVFLNSISRKREVLWKISLWSGVLRRGSAWSNCPLALQVCLCSQKCNSNPDPLDLVERYSKSQQYLSFLSGWNMVRSETDPTVDLRQVLVDCKNTVCFKV